MDEDVDEVVEGGKKRSLAPQAKGLKDGELLRALAQLAISHDESLRELEAAHHSTFLLPSASALAEILKVTGDKYHKTVKELGPEHQMGPPTGYLLMALVSELQELVEKLAEDQKKKDAKDALGVLERRLAEAFIHDGEAVTGCHLDKIAKLVPTLKSRTIKSGQRLVSLRMEGGADTEALITIISLVERETVVKHGKGPRGHIVRKLQQTLSSGK